MAELFNAASTSDAKQFYDAFIAALSDPIDETDKKNILPIAYEILAEKFAEVDRLISASKNDNYVSVPVVDELVIRSEKTGDLLRSESAHKITAVRVVPSTSLYPERQQLNAGTTSIVLSNVPSDILNRQISYLNNPQAAYTIEVLSFNESTNTIQISPLVYSGFYEIKYTVTGDVFDSVEVTTIVSASEAEVHLKTGNLVFDSESIGPVDEPLLVKDIDYVINYVDGVVNLLSPTLLFGKRISFRYKYRRDLLNDVFLRSHVPVTNEIATPVLS